MIHPFLSFFATKCPSFATLLWLVWHAWVFLQKPKPEAEDMKGKVLAINTGSTSTKVGYFVDGKAVLVRDLELSAQEVLRFSSVLEQENLRRGIVMDFLRDAGVGLGDIDIVMARGGLFAPAVTGVYAVNDDMREVLLSGRDGIHACNLSAVIADDIAVEATAFRRERGIGGRACMAYVADPPMADEMLPECRLGGLPEFPRRAFFHALNSRAIVRRYLREHGHPTNDVTAIVAHMGGGVTVTLHRNGKVIDTNNGLGGDGPFTPERAGSCPAFPLIEMCFRSGMSEREVKRRVLGQGGAVAYFGTNDLRELESRAARDPKVDTWLNAFGLNVAKYIASLAATVDGHIDVILLTGGIARDGRVVSDIRRRTAFVAPTEVYPGENELDSLAENGYLILAGTVKIHRYDKERLLEEELTN
jgi:butyrate kinase